jgi:hypothetical protein
MQSNQRTISNVSLSNVLCIVLYSCLIINLFTIGGNFVKSICHTSVPYFLFDTADSVYVTAYILSSLFSYFTFIFSSSVSLPFFLAIFLFFIHTFHLIYLSLLLDCFVASILSYFLTSSIFIFLSLLSLSLSLIHFYDLSVF